MEPDITIQLETGSRLLWKAIRKIVEIVVMIVLTALFGTTVFKQKHVEHTPAQVSLVLWLDLDTHMALGTAIGEVSIDNLFTISKN